MKIENVPSEDNKQRLDAVKFIWFTNVIYIDAFVWC